MCVSSYFVDVVVVVAVVVFAFVLVCGCGGDCGVFLLCWLICLVRVLLRCLRLFSCCSSLFVYCVGG